MKVVLTPRQKRQLERVLKEIEIPSPEVKKGMLGWVDGIRIRFDDLFNRKKRIKNTYEFFKPYYEIVGMDFSKKDAETIRFNVAKLGRKLRDIAEEEMIEIDEEEQGR